MQVVSVPVSTVQPAVYAIPAQRANVAVKEIRTLGILQIVFGSLSVLFGILAVAILQYWAGSSGFGIWTGIWIIVAGGLGVGSAGNPNNGCLNGFHMAFSIIACFLSFIDFIIYAVSVSYFRSLQYSQCYYYYYRQDAFNCNANKSKWSTGVAFYVILLLLMLAEFIVALTAAIYCCKAGCGSCCQPSSPGVIIQQQPAAQQHMIIQTSGAPGQMQPAYLPPYSQPMVTGYNPQSQPMVTAYNPQVQFTSASGIGQYPAQTAVTYVQGMPPQNIQYNQQPMKNEGPPPAY